MRTEIKNYLAQNFDNNGNHALKNVVQMILLFTKSMLSTHFVTNIFLDIH